MRPALRSLALPQACLGLLMAALTQGAAPMALADPVSSPVVTSTYLIPLQTFAYTNAPGSLHYKYGINLALGGSTSPAIFEFDTGGDGFFAAFGNSASWWGADYSPAGNNFSKGFDSGYTYDGITLTTSISFFGLGSNPGSPIFTTPSSYTVGATNTIKLAGTDTWTAAGGSGSPPVDQNFFGDFGLTLKRGGEGIQNLLAQLTYGGDASAGYKVVLGPYGSSGGAYLQLGLQSTDLSNSATTWFPMQGADPSKPFANSNLPSFSAELLTGDLQLNFGGNNNSLSNIGFNLDSGTPGVTLHYNDSDKSLLVPYSVLSNGDPVRLQNGVTIGLQVQPAGSALAQTLLSFVAEDDYGLNQVLTRRRSDGDPTYVNTGASLFQSYAVTYDLANQRVGLTPYPVPAPSPLAAGLLSGALGLRLRNLRRRIRAGGSPRSAQAGGIRATAAR